MTSDGGDPYPRSDEIREAVLAEMRAGGKPCAKYQELDAHRNCDWATSAWLTARIIRNYEDRLVALEEGTGYA